MLINFLQFYEVSKKVLSYYATVKKDTCDSSSFPNNHCHKQNSLNLGNFPQFLPIAKLLITNLSIEEKVYKQLNTSEKQFLPLPQGQLPISLPRFPLVFYTHFI